jgi:hypothetical protein
MPEENDPLEAELGDESEGLILKSLKSEAEEEQQCAVSTDESLSHAG